MAHEEVRVANIELVLKTTIELFIENGIQNTTREMIARKSGLSRRSTERYFSSKAECVAKAAEWFGEQLYQELHSVVLLADRNMTAADILTMYLGELKELFEREPRYFVCYAEFKAFLYRNSPHRQQDYRKFMEAVGFRRILRQIFEKGEQDGTVKGHYSAEANARYLTNTIMAYFSNVVLLYDTEPELMHQYIDEYVADTLSMYCCRHSA